MSPLRSLPSAGSGLLTCLTLSLLVLGLSSSSTAELLPSSHLLVPYFEVDLARPEEGLTTVFSVVNSSHRTTNVRFRVHSNWGIPVLELTLALRDGEVRSVNLRDWIGDGNLPDRQLSDDELAHLQAALTGKPSPKDSLYYSSEVEPGLAVGYITIYSPPTDQGGTLWGDVYTSSAERSSLQAGALVSLVGSPEAMPSCKRHAVRFWNSSELVDRTQILIWTGRRLTPSATPAPTSGLLAALIKVRDEAGADLEQRSLEVLPVQVVEVGDSHLEVAFGWLDIRTESPALVGAHLHATTGESAELRSYCIPEGALLEDPSSITLRLLANGEETSLLPGPRISMGSSIDWEYRVSNEGSFPLTGIVITDGVDRVACATDSLGPGESMLCATQSLAVACQNAREVQVTAVAPDGSRVSSQRVAYYYGQHHAALQMIASINGDDANEPPGPEIETYAYYGILVGFSIQLVWTNTGDVPLYGVVVSDPTPGCAGARRLNPGESASCRTQNNRIEVGLIRYDVAVTGKPPCGPEVTASDHAYYTGTQCIWGYPCP